jgi:hypothetical protein
MADMNREAALFTVFMALLGVGVSLPVLRPTPLPSFLGVLPGVES